MEHHERVKEDGTVKIRVEGKDLREGKDQWEKWGCRGGEG